MPLAARLRAALPPAIAALALATALPAQGATASPATVTVLVTGQTATMRSPRYEDAAFEVRGNTTITVTVR